MGSPRRLLVAAVAGLLALIVSLGVVSAHVTVWPKQSSPGAYERYTVRVPTEKDIPTVKVEVKFPKDLRVVAFQPKPGWTYTTEKDATGNITGVIWSGGKIGVGQFDEFGFMAANPKEPTQLAFKAYQTYADGSVVSWVGPPNSEHPASVTSITTSATASGGSVEEPGSSGGTSGTTVNASTTGGSGSAATVASDPNSAPLGLTGTFWISIAALVIGLVALGGAALTLSRRTDHTT